jgi:S-(hydroxymethyl)glutathione dehydrogenase/alcohol dehydrogenase
VITGVGAALNTAQVRPGQSTVVIGVGGVGLNVVQGAAIAGAYPIVAVDLSKEKLEASLQFGATHTVDASSKDTVDQVRKITDGGADFCFAAVGSESAINQGLDMLGRDGTEVVVGLPPAGATISIPARKLVIPRLGGPMRIIGSNMGSTRLQSDIPRLIQHYRNGRLKLDELVTKEYPFDKINDAIDSSERGEALRNVVVF